MATPDELRAGILGAAQQLGINPVDLATAISYETAGRFDPNIAGPRTKWGQHKGLLQWGEPQAQKYLGGDFSIPSQMKGAVSYLQDAGVQPGMGLKDIYSAINAGRVGRYGASDAAAGGAPGTVADKVAGMGDHRAKAEALIGGQPMEIAAGPSAPTPAATPASAKIDAPPGLMAMLTGDEKKDDSALNPIFQALMAGSQKQQQPQIEFEPTQPAPSQMPPLQQYLAEFLKTRMRA